MQQQSAANAAAAAASRQHFADLSMQVNVICSCIISDQLTLSQPGGKAHYPHPVLRAPPPDFQTLRRPCLNSLFFLTRPLNSIDNRCS